VNGKIELENSLGIFHYMAPELKKKNE